MEERSGYSDEAFVAEFYDHFPAYAGRPDIEFWVEAARESGGPVLEVGCGTGRVLVPTARAGLEVTGLDLSPNMLAKCRERLAVEPPEVRRRATLVQGDMRAFDLGRTFAMVTIPFRPFQHLVTVEDQMACLACVRAHLADGGRFIMDLFNPSLPRLVDEKYLKEGGGASMEMPDGRRVVRRERLARRDLFGQVNYCELIYYVTHPDGREERLVHAFPMRYLFRYEVEHLLARCGFNLEAVYADYDKSPYGSKDPGELICVARKAPSDRR